MRTAIALGGGDTLWSDIKAYDGPIDGVVACNDAGAEWSGQLDAWVTLHPEKFQKLWLKKREENGFPPAKRLVAHRQPRPDLCPILDDVSEYMFPGMKHTGSSGLFVAKYALMDLGFDRVVLCGVPMTQSPHFFDDISWKSAESYRQKWIMIPKEYRVRMRSMSGWTRALLGSKFHD